MRFDVSRILEDDTNFVNSIIDVIYVIDFEKMICLAVTAKTGPLITWRRGIIVLLDAGALLGGYLLAFLLRFDFHPAPEYLRIMSDTVVYVVGAFYFSAYWFALYRNNYAYSSFPDLVNISKTLSTSGIVSTAIILFVRQGQYPRSILILGPILNFLGVCGVRFGIRMIRDRMRIRALMTGDPRKVLLIGAGELGESLIRQILKTPELNYQVVGLIDDDPAKWHQSIQGCSVLGGRTSMPEILRREKIDEVIIAISQKRGEIVASVMNMLRGLDPRPEVKIAPGLGEMLRTPGELRALRKVKPSDLLNREVISLDEPRIARVIEQKVVLITGAGGTIGSEIGRQVLKFDPEKIVILESHATSLFYSEATLRKSGRGTAVVPILGDVRDQGLIERVFMAHRPHVVLHAAAHKHVHQLEFNVQEGVSNNLLGTHYLAAAADKFSAECFLLVSTDKAVQPSSVMGATKRAAEKVVESWARRSRTRFCSVRFGNVLGSSGSVLPIFEQQIAAGGPVTVTDARATRYFMTAEEAVGLILQAVSLSKGGEVFVLKMGTPVKIIDMARNLILLSGLEPDKDIEIRIVGLKQGEKVDEQLAEDLKALGPSSHPDIHLLRPAEEPSDDLQGNILEIELLSRGANSKALLRKLSEVVPSFQPADAQLDPAA